MSLHEEAGMVWIFQNMRKEVLPDRPVKKIDPRNLALRQRLIVSEIGELFDAMGEEDLVEIADGICDAIYVLLGTANAYGLTNIMTSLFNEVQRSNMTKFAVAAVGQKYGPGEKTGKGAGYEPPIIKEILDRFMARREQSTGYKLNEDGTHSLLAIVPCCAANSEDSTKHDLDCRRLD